jgi:arsenate reductase
LSADTSHQGSCLCGKYSFVSRGVPRFVAHCHCRSCRRALGAGVATYVGYAADQVTFADAAGLENVPSYQSSPGVRRGFCDVCGTALYYASDQWSGETHLFRSNFAQPEAFEPTGHGFFSDRESDFDLYDDLPRYAAGSSLPVAWGKRPAHRILYLCQDNASRSILAEAITNLRCAQIAGKRVRAHSAGSQPAGNVNPKAEALIQDRYHLTGRSRSKSWDEFIGPEAPDLDLVITLGDSTAVEPGPIFPGVAEKRHWGVPDPASGAASFAAIFQQLEALIEGLLQELDGG